jgi:hypothetical protein
MPKVTIIVTIDKIEIEFSVYEEYEMYKQLHNLLGKEE